MRRTTAAGGDGDRIEARVRIGREVGDVFRFYRNFENLPGFLGDVTAVEPVGNPFRPVAEPEGTEVTR